MNAADRMRAYLDGWDDAERCVYRTLASVPAEHLANLVAVKAAEHTVGPITIGGGR